MRPNVGSRVKPRKLNVSSVTVRSADGTRAAVISTDAETGGETRVDVAGVQRSEGYRAAIREAGLAATDCPVIGLGKMWSIDVGYSGAVRALTDSRGRVKSPARRPTAIFAVNDRVATGALLALAQLGLSVPGDVSVLGFDDQEQLAAHVVPALTTFALPHRQMGEVAVDRLLGHLGRQREAMHATTLRLHCPLIERDSTAPVPA